MKKIARRKSSGEGRSLILKICRKTKGKINYARQLVVMRSYHSRRLDTHTAVDAAWVTNYGENFATFVLIDGRITYSHKFSVCFAYVIKMSAFSCDAEGVCTRSGGFQTVSVFE